MTTPPTIPTLPYEHPTMDHAHLRARAIDLLGRYAGAQWTDYNTHDPGITILEQLCYAITDLAYRIDHPIEDLLAGNPALPGPAELLPCDPVTRDDLRRLALTVPGVRNAWAQPIDAVETGISQRPLLGEIWLSADPLDRAARPVTIAGLHRVVVDGAETRAQVEQTLHARRALAEDFEVVECKTFEIGVQATIEIGPTDDPGALLRAITRTIAERLRPTVDFTPLRDVLAADDSAALLESPCSARGVPTGELPEPSDSVRTSDLLRAIMADPLVRVVPSLVLVSPQGAAERWVLKVPRGKVPVLSDSLTKITLRRAGLAVTSTTSGQRSAAAATRPSTPAPPPAPPRGRDRRLAAYSPLLRHLPAIYRVAAFDATGRAPARTRQLAGYLLFFDQLLADAFAQLAHARQLLAPDATARSYFSQPLDDLRRLVAGAGESPAPPPPIETPELACERRLRFLNHLLARFAERFGEHTLGPDDPAQTLATRAAFLRDYPRLSAGRGGGYDILAGTRGGFEERLRLKLGLPADPPPFHVVEHVLLRPLAEDHAAAQTELDPAPLLTAVDRADPWSHQVSLVFRGEHPSAARTLIEDTVSAELPAHIGSRILRLDERDWAAFEVAWQTFRDALGKHRRNDYPPKHQQDVQLRLRDARDRVIDSLRLGKPAPLHDLPVDSATSYPAHERAPIVLPFRQPDATYTLFEVSSAAPWQQVATADGGTDTLWAPPDSEPRTYWIRAERLGRTRWFNKPLTILRGVDTGVRVRFDDGVGLLEPDSQPAADAPRLVDHGAAATVRIARQASTTYTLADITTGHPVELRGDLVTALADVDLRVSGTIGDDTRILDQQLRLRVRARTDLLVRLANLVVPHHGGASVIVDTSEPGVSYQAWLRPIEDREYLFDGDEPALSVRLADHIVRVRAGHPRIGPQNAVIDDFGSYRAGTSATGDGRALSLPLGPLEEDSVVVVLATRSHRAGPLATPGKQIQSVVMLTTSCLQLVEPDASRVLELEPADQGLTRVKNGQRGVFYELRTAPADPLLAQVYFHKPDKGIGEPGAPNEGLRLGVDFAVAHDTAIDLPHVDLRDVPSRTKLVVRARRAMSGVTRDLTHVVKVP